METEGSSPSPRTLRQGPQVQGPEADPGPVPAKNIVWLASYPKSGNTWFRVFLANLCGDQEDGADINALDEATIASARAPFDVATGIEAGDLTPDEVDLLRPRVYESWSAARPEKALFHKIHDAYGYTQAGEPLVSVQATRGAIYIVRNPLDVAMSYAHHSNTTTEVAVDRLCDTANAFGDATDRLHGQLRQRLTTWSDHVRSWTRAREIDVHVVRYEDMKRSPIETFNAAARFAGLDHGEAAISRAIDRSTFENLKQQEMRAGFREKSRRAQSFFREGKVGSWREALTPEQVARVVARHGVVMRELGYLVDGQPVDGQPGPVSEPIARRGP